MDFLGGSVADFCSEGRTESARDLREDFRGDFDGASRAEPEGTRDGPGLMTRTKQNSECRDQISECRSTEAESLTTDGHGWTQITNRQPKEEVRTQNAEVRMSGSADRR